ncbi:hypothetical protein CXG81DRAFT_1629, partial [Caulochytrium protostelioides]
MKHNNVLPNQHLRKDWKSNVKTWFNQPAQARIRRAKRAQKAARIAPRPVDGPLRPAVHCPTLKYNTKIRAGRGFTLSELKLAGLDARKAKTIGIAVDFRRKNRSVEGRDANVERLKVYLSKLVVFPRKTGKPKAGDSTAEQIAAARQLTTTLMPIARQATAETSRATVDSKVWAFGKLRTISRSSKNEGHMDKLAKAKAAAE